MTTPSEPTRITARCGSSRHGWCPGRVYVLTDTAMLIDCECGCGCSPRIPVSRPGAARTRRRQLAARAAAKRDRDARRHAARRPPTGGPGNASDL